MFRQFLGGYFFKWPLIAPYENNIISHDGNYFSTMSERRQTMKGQQTEKHNIYDSIEVIFA